ncbi:hypothetical protein MTO96_044832 [Rhipicephalus appendiculatus]
MAAATASPSAGQQPSFYLEQEKQLPGVVISSGGNVFEMLYQLASMDDPRIAEQVQTLLHLIPPDPAVIDALDQICMKSSPATPPVPPPRLSGSPKKSGSPAPREKTPVGSDVVLRRLLDPNGRNPFRLLYNLQVLSARLMPTNQDACSNVFCENFLQAGGLSHVLRVLHRDGLPQDVDYAVRQGIYFTALQITRFLICGQNVPHALQSSSTSSVSTTCGAPSPVKPTTPKKLQVDLVRMSPFSTVTPIIKSMSRALLEEVVDSLVRVAWAAAAGQLRLTNSPLPTREGTHFAVTTAGRRSRQSSTGSATSSGSDGENSLGLHGGICVSQDTVDRKDALLAQEALSFLFSCLELREDVSAWFCELPCVRDFVLDVLLGCGSEELLLKAHLPLWVPSSYTRGSNQRLLGQCVEYFDLACRLLADSKGDAPVDVAQMLEDEIAWLHSFSPSDSPHDRSMDATLMTGHFHLVRTLVACNGDERKSDVGQSLVATLLESYLFPASSLIEKSAKDDTPEPAGKPKCSEAEPRTAAFSVLVELARCCPTNLERIVRWLVDRHHQLKSELIKEFEYEPLIAGRAESGYVGLKNAGATCYMNSVLQQLFMQPGLQEAVLAIDSDKVEEESLLFQTQSVFGHLLESQMEYHVPEQFWQCFRLWGAPVNVREQQDAFEFFNHLLDQVDEYLLKIGCDPVFKPFYEGTFSDQKICQGCPHR